MPNLESNPTGTALMQAQLGIAIRKVFRNRLNKILKNVQSNKITIEKFIATESTLDPLSIGAILIGLEGLNKDIKPIMFDILAKSWLKGNNDITTAINIPFLPANINAMQSVQKRAFTFIEKYADEKKKELNEILSNGISQGDSITTISKEIRNAFKTTAWKSEQIARSEVIRAYNESSFESMKAAGIKQYKWITALEGKSPVSGALDKALHGRVFNIGEKGNMRVVGTDGKTYTIPKNPLPVTDTHPNCRCRISAAINIPK